MSVSLLGTPPLILTIKPKRIVLKLDSNYIPTVVANILLYALVGKLAITILCSSMLPKMYVFWSIGRRGKGGYILSSISFTAAVSTSKAYIYPTV